jgi:hypothetical protein
MYGSTVFGKGVRRSWAVNKEKSQNPGPGNYRHQTEFGFYCPADIYGWTQTEINKKGKSLASSGRNSIV